MTLLPDLPEIHGDQLRACRNACIRARMIFIIEALARCVGFGLIPVLLLNLLKSEGEGAFFLVLVSFIWLLMALGVFCFAVGEAIKPSYRPAVYSGFLEVSLILMFHGRQHYLGERMYEIYAEYSRNSVDWFWKHLSAGEVLVSKDVALKRISDWQRPIATRWNLATAQCANGHTNLRRDWRRRGDGATCPNCNTQVEQRVDWPEISWAVFFNEMYGNVIHQQPYISCGYGYNHIYYRRDCFSESPLVKIWEACGRPPYPFKDIS